MDRTHTEERAGIEKVLLKKDTYAENAEIIESEQGACLHTNVFLTSIFQLYPTFA